MRDIIDPLLLEYFCNFLGNWRAPLHVSGEWPRLFHLWSKRRSETSKRSRLETDRRSNRAIWEQIFSTVGMVEINYTPVSRAFKAIYKEVTVKSDTLN